MQFLTIASAVLGAVSSLNNASRQEAQYKAQADANRYNAAIQRQRAEAIRSVSNQKEENQRRLTRIQLGKLRAAGAQAGLGTGGSIADVEAQSEVMAELDALNIRYEGEMNARGALNQASYDEWNAANDEINAKRAKSAGYLGAATSLLSGATGYFGNGGWTQAPAPVSDATIRMVN